MLYYRKLLREAGIDVTEIESLTRDRKKWRSVVKERMDHLLKYDWSCGNIWSGNQIERNVVVEAQDVWVCDVCAKVCKSKAGLTIHKKRMHLKSVMKKSFHSDKCGKTFSQEANLANHKKHSVECGDPVERVPRTYKGERGPCPECGKTMSKTNIARHIRESCKP